MRRRALTWGPVLALVVFALLFGGRLTAWVSGLARPTAQTAVAVPVEQAPAIAAAEPQWIVPPRPVKTFKPEVKKALALPAAVQADDAKHVLQAARLSADDSPREVTAVLDEQTGETELLARALPRPWLDATPRGEAGVFAGIRNGHEPVARLTARQQLLQVKAVRIGVVGSVDVPMSGGDIDSYVGVGAWTTW